MVASKIQNPAAAAAEFGVLVLKDFADWPFPESAAAKLKAIKIWFRGLGIIITTSAKYKNAKY